MGCSTAPSFGSWPAKPSASLPDQTIRPVSQAHKKSLALHRLVGETLLNEFGSAEEAYQALVGNAGHQPSAQKLLANLDRSGCLSLGVQDKQRILFEFQQAGSLQKVDLGSFKKVLVGNHRYAGGHKSRSRAALPPACAEHDWHAESKSGQDQVATRIPSARDNDKALLARVRGFCETKRAWGVGMRDVYLMLDSERSGSLSARTTVERLSSLGLQLSGDDKQRLARLLSTGGGDSGKTACTYADFADALSINKELQPHQGAQHVQALNNAAQPAIVHNFKQRRHVKEDQENGHRQPNGPRCPKAQSTCTVERALEMLCARGKTVAEVYLGAKASSGNSGKALDAEALRATLETAAGLTINPREFQRSLRQAGISAGQSTNLQFEDFNRLLNVEGRARRTSHGCEMARKAPCKVPFEQQRQGDKPRMGFSSPKAVGELRGERAKRLLCPQQPRRESSPRHKTARPPAAPAPAPAAAAAAEGRQQSKPVAEQGTKVLKLKMSPPMPEPSSIPME